MTWQKRLLDILFACVLVVALSPLIIGLLLWLWIRQGRPLFYAAERMKTPDQGFTLWKLRTMQVTDDDQGVSGGNKDARITRIGAMLRRRRIDELPQLFNILRGDLSFVGPRPPLREYVERFPEVYNEVLKSRPGVTGLATLVYNEHEGALLSRCSTSQQTDDVYCRACVPRKAHLDLIYQQHQSICFDFDLVFQTIGGIVPRSRPK
ncbi:MAG: lipopolysaccharide/colanic/teichoic acid biosynthesis glycosyltransferase [Paracoccaceae bacterium]|jgi:lipopolysaccharide/colanic/teichoic acid biosynthesis glycosyltransferase